MDGVYVVQWTEEVPVGVNGLLTEPHRRLLLQPDWAQATACAASHNGHAEFVPFGREVFEYLRLR